MDHIRVARVHLDLASQLGQDGQHTQAVNLIGHAILTFDERTATALSSQARHPSWNH